MSIRTFLTLVIALMGAALLAVVGARMATEADRSGKAQRVATLAEISQSLLPAMISARIERGTLVVAGMAADPADAASWQRIAEHRPVTDAMSERSILALRGAPLSEGAELARRLNEAHESLMAIRPEMDAAIRLAREQRDQRLLDAYGQASADYVIAITAAADAVDQATALFDPEIDRLIFLNRQVSAARNYTSLITLRMEDADAFNLPWRASDVVTAATDAGRADLAWQSALSVAAGPGIPDSLNQAIAAAKTALSGPDAKRQAEIIGTLQSGRPAGVGVSELQKLDTGLLMPLNEVLRVSTAEIVARAMHFQHEARVRVALTAALLLVILFLTGLGIAVVQRRVSGPIRRITRQMSLLSEAGLAETDADLHIEDGFEADAKRRDEIGEMARALLVFRRQVEDRGRRLQEHEMRQFLEALIDAMPVSITFKDTDLRYRYVNRSRRAALGDVLGDALGATLGNKSLELVGKRLSDVVVADYAAQVEEADRAVLATGEPQEFEQARNGPDGKPAIIWSLKTPFRDPDGTVRGIITCGVDITRLKQIEAELKAQREKAEAANRAKSAFLASMSHELRTPLNAIIGFSDALAKGYLGTLPQRQQEYIGDIRSSGEHLLKLVNDLLDLSSLEIGRQILVISECSFDSVAVAAMSMVQTQAQQGQVTLDFVPSRITLRADERALTQILVNLLGNAIKFTPPGGRIALRAMRQGDEIRIQVADTGFGMTEAQRTRALAATLAPDFAFSLELGAGFADPYKTRPKGGAGIGLAICRRLIEQHNGTLEIESRHGEGSTVHVVLPAA
ncbi:MAG TPA: PAS domain-containing sensor histidine kinase [Candidatus Cybelea sp.]|nr:PAS domain-containing sensor histidine kinase [Candidatus Cybelea sp.]